MLGDIDRVHPSGIGDDDPARAGGVDIDAFIAGAHIADNLGARQPIQDGLVERTRARIGDHAPNAWPDLPKKRRTIAVQPEAVKVETRRQMLLQRR
jgi:hypothetical protein